MFVPQKAAFRQPRDEKSGLAAKISGTGRTPMVENRKPDQADSLGRDHHR